MNKWSYLFFALVLSNLAYAEQSQNTNGQVLLKKKNDSQACATLDIKAQKAAYMGDYPCSNDEVYDFKLEQATKDSVIVLGADDPKGADDCPLGDWRFHLKVTSDTPLNTDWISIESLRNKNSGDNVLPGLMMQKNEYHRGSIAGKLSCVDTLPAS